MGKKRQKFEKAVTIDFSKIKDDEVDEWAKSIGQTYVDEIPSLTVTIEVEFDLSEFDDTIIMDEFRSRFDIAGIYQMMAAGRADEAMEAMSRAFDLPAPHHELKIANLLSRGRGSSHVQN